MIPMTGENIVYIFSVCFNDFWNISEKLFKNLSADEIKRAKRFHFENDKKHFIIGRGILRSLLGKFLNTEPSSIAFSYAKNGKPSIVIPADNNLFFNISHSHNRIVLALSYAADLGIDIEFRKELLDIDRLAKNYFSMNENKIFSRLTEQEKSGAFFDCWTRKEAFVKAVGGGLTIPFNSFDVSVESCKSPKLLRVGGNYTTVEEWQLFNLQMAKGYSGALAIKANNVALHYLNLKDDLTFEPDASLLSFNDFLK
jgi:4'-phosphopantetheinyl transferase